MSGSEPSRVVEAFDPNRLSAIHGIALAGLAVIGIGVYLPWVDEPQVRVYVLGMESGFERQWGKRLLLGAVLGVVLVLASLSPRGRWSVVGPLLGAIGAVTVVVAVVTTPLTGRWDPETGVYVTLAGGLLVAVASLASLVGTRVRRRQAGSRPSAD